MVLSEEGDALALKHAEICGKLNLDTQTVAESWELFQAINQNFTLEGDPLHWLACAIYEVCWKSVTPTIGQSYLQGNCTNLITLLRHCNLSVNLFFDKILNWSDMSKLPEDFKQKVTNLQTTFYVVCNLFKIYQDTYVEIFKPPEPLDPEYKQHRNRKQRPVPCTSLKVFEFCWTLFITIKEEEPVFNNELVPLCHLLRAVCDWAFKNAFLADRRDLLNPHFQGLPSDWHTPEYVVPEKEGAPCIVRHLTSNEHVIDVKYVKEYPLKKFIRNLFDRGVLTGKDDDENNVLDSSVFERNFRNISNTYDANFLNKGDFDERIFLADFRRRLLEREQSQNHPPNSSSQAHDAGDSSGAEVTRETTAGPQACLTPLTGRRYIGPREPNELSNSAAESVTRLHTLLSGRQAAPGEALVQLFESCQRDPTEKVCEIVTRLGERFVSTFPNDLTELTKKRLQLATTLFYKLVESILLNEKSIHRDLSAIVEKDLFYECMFACSLEIVIFAHKIQRKFPWILEVLGIQSYNFVKVIELIVRSKDQLSRGVLKHLSMIEETIISSSVWKSNSLLWEAIELSGQDVPKFEETALPGHMQTDQNSNGSCLRKILNSDAKQIESPGPSATDRFQSPGAPSNIVNRQLFPSLQSGQSLLRKQTHLVIKDQNGVTKMIPIVSNEAPKQQVQLQSSTQQPNSKLDNSPPAKPKRTGGLSIIFRKFYNLAGERMEHLCAKLSISSVEVKREIWTVFEESVRLGKCRLMKDRDLDQLLMCAVYMICKLNKSYSRNFADIMKSYRTQPQAVSDIYRNVLIAGRRTETIDDKVVEHPEQRGDLIKFYNTVVIQALKKFAEKFVNHGTDLPREVPLSPLPASRRHMASPSVQIIDNVFVKPLESPRAEPTVKTYNYYFSRSPSKDLKDINRAIRGNGVQGKRLLVDGDTEPNSKRIAHRKVQSLMEERKSQNAE